MNRKLITLWSAFLTENIVTSIFSSFCLALLSNKRHKTTSTTTATRNSQLENMQWLLTTETPQNVSKTGDIEVATNIYFKKLENMFYKLFSFSNFLYASKISGKSFLSGVSRPVASYPISSAIPIKIG
jgi:hypothetical protein